MKFYLKGQLHLMIFHLFRLVNQNLRHQEFAKQKHPKYENTVKYKSENIIHVWELLYFFILIAGF